MVHYVCVCVCDLHPPLQHRECSFPFLKKGGKYFFTFLCLKTLMAFITAEKSFSLLYHAGLICILLHSYYDYAYFYTHTYMVCGLAELFKSEAAVVDNSYFSDWNMFIENTCSPCCMRLTHLLSDCSLPLAQLYEL